MCRAFFLLGVAACVGFRARSTPCSFPSSVLLLLGVLLWCRRCPRVVRANPRQNPTLKVTARGCRNLK